MSQSLRRRDLLAAAPLIAPSLLAQAARGRPNIVLLLTDDQRYDTVRALGHPIVQTPHMDALVRQGTAFRNTSIMGGTVSAICTPSRAMMLSGQHLFHAHDNLMGGLKASPHRPRKPYHLFPELLRQSGYRTFFSGKWGNGKDVLNRCFDDARNIFFHWAREGMNQSRFPVSQHDPSGLYPAATEQRMDRFTSEVFTDPAVEFIEKYRRPEPFFLYTAYLSPHDPRTPPARFASLYDTAKMPLPANYQPQHPFYNGHRLNRDEMLAPIPRTPEIIRQHIAAYYGMISEVDHQIGRVLDALDRTGLAKNTVVIFAADNGLALGQHGLLGKQNLYDHSIRVPLVMRGPGIPADRRSAAPVYLHDLFPTICEIAGISTPETVESRSLLPLLNDPGAEHRSSTFHAFRHMHRAVRQDGYKLVLFNVNGVRTTQLFDLREDPLEQYNAGGEKRHIQRIAAMTATLRAWTKSTDDYIDIDRPDWGGATLGEGS